MVAGLNLRGANLQRLGRAQMASVPGARRSQATLERGLREAEQSAAIPEEMSIGLFEAVRQRVLQAANQALDVADPRAAAARTRSLISQGFQAGEEIVARARQRRQEIVFARAQALAQQTQAGFQGAPVSAIVSGLAQIEAARIAAKAQKGSGILGLAAGVAGGLLGGPFGAALGGAVFGQLDPEGE